MTDQMLAALDAGGGRYTVRSLPLPERFPRSALIRVRQTGICGTDLHAASERSEPEAFPGGHEIAGEILELPPDEGVDASGAPLRVGDRVAIPFGRLLGRACGNCYYCRIGQKVHCRKHGRYSSGGFAEYVTRLPVDCYRLPGSLDWEGAALVEPFACSVHALRYRNAMKPGDTVAVIGAGTIGLGVIAAATALGAGRVIASAKYAHQAKLAEVMGASIVTSTDGDKFEVAVRDVTNGLGADVAVETIGGRQTATLEQAVRVCRNQGTVSVAGLTSSGALQVDLKALFRAELILGFSFGYGVVDGRHDVEVAIDLLATGRVPLRRIVTHTFTLPEFQKAFDTASDKRTGAVKVQIAQR